MLEWIITFMPLLAEMMLLTDHQKIICFIECGTAALGCAGHRVRSVQSKIIFGNG